MNFLQLAQRTVIEAGISGRNTTVANATGEWLRVVNWVNQAWLDIQNEHNGAWRWMRTTKTFQTIANQGEYAFDQAPLSLTDFAWWHENAFRIYKNTIDNEDYLYFREYNWFRDANLIGTNRTTAAYPSEITISPTNSLMLFQLPDSTDYYVSGDYQKTPTELTLDADIPDMPVRFHMAIVWKALIHYGGKESYPDAYSRGKELYKKLMYQLEQDQLPRVMVDRRFL